MRADGQQTTLERAFLQDDFDRFAALSGDDNPIHTDPVFAARTRFGRTVAHGLLLCAVLRGLVEQLAPGRSLGQQKVMFPAPTYVGEMMRFTAIRRADEVQLEVRRVADGEITLSGSCRVTP
jgi:acyl dehydratase